MGKRSDFERVPRDFYPTPLAAVRPLVPHLPIHSFYYWEPCAGDGRLIDHLDVLRPDSTCLMATDIEPRRDDIDGFDALGDYEVHSEMVDSLDLIITNPPWDRSILHPIIEKLSSIAPTWLLFDADWMHTKQAAPYLGYLTKVVSIGRVKWIEGSKMTGKDNCCWYLFDKGAPMGETRFYGREV